MEKIAKFVVELVGAMAVVLVTAPLLIAALVSFLLPRFVVVLAPFRRPHLAEMMKGVTQFFALESFQGESSCNIIVHIVCDGTISLDSLRQQFQMTLIPTSIMNSTPDPYARLRQLWTKYMFLLLGMGIGFYD